MTSHLVGAFSPHTCGGVNATAVLTLLTNLYKCNHNGSSANSLFGTLLPFGTDLDIRRDEILSPFLPDGKYGKEMNSLIPQGWIKELDGGAFNDPKHGTKRVKGDPLLILGGYDIVSTQLAKLHLALRKVGKCEQGYEWKLGSFTDPCDKCAKPTGSNGYNCAGGGHFVCRQCVRAAMNGGGGGGGDSDDDGPPAILYPRDQCLIILKECNAQVPAKGANMQQLMQIHQQSCQKNGVQDSDR